MRRDLSLLAGFLCFSGHLAVAANPPFPAILDRIIGQMCGQTVDIVYSAGMPQVRASVTEMLARMDSLNYLARRAEFEARVYAYLLRETGSGRPATLVGHEIEKTIQLLYSETTKPEDMDRHFRRMSDDSRAMRAFPDVPVARRELPDLGIRPKHPLLRELMAEFGRASVPLYFLSLEEWLRRIARATLLPYGNSIPLDATEVHPDVISILHHRILTSLAMNGLYSHRLGPVGLYFPRYLSNPVFRATVIHEAEHAVQDAFWSEMVALEFYLNAVRPNLGVLKERLAPLSRFDKAARLKREDFLDSPLQPERDKVIGEGTKVGMDSVDWILYVDLWTILKEYDAHLKAGLLAEEEGYPVPSFQPERLYEYLKAMYTSDDSSRSIEGFSFAVFPQRVVELGVKELNEKKRFKRKLGSP